MTVKYFKYAFAVDGNVTPIPDPTQGSDILSYQQGFSVRYALDAVDPSSLNIPRDQFNQLMNDVTGAIQQVQQNGFPIHITAAMNGGTAYGYSVNSFVRATDTNVYYSLINNNTDVPPSVNWQVFINGSSGGSILTGMQVDYWGSTLPPGYVWPNNTTIGNASSNATGRANADTSALFALFWSWSPSLFPMYTSLGVLQARGANAAADFAANYAITVPDCLERVRIGAGTMGGAADPNRITVAGSGISGATVGASGGTQTVELVTVNLPIHAHAAGSLAVDPHNHSFATPDHTHSSTTISINTAPPGANIGGAGSGSAAGTYTTGLGGGFSGSTGNATPAVTGSTDNTGAGTPHRNVQPGIVCNTIIKL